MGWTKPTTITSWSFSRYDLYSKCPLAAKLKFIDKVPEPPPEPDSPMLRGARIAKETEDYLKKHTSRIPADIKKLDKEFQFLRKQRTLMAEETWGFTADWTPCAWNDWNNCVIRIKIDAAYIDAKENTLHIFDGKSGRYRPDANQSYLEQLSLYVAGGGAKFPEVERITSRLLYTDHGIVFPYKGQNMRDPAPITHDQRGAAKLRKDWDKKVKPMLADKRFPPRPGDHCRWCFHSKAKGGRCKF